MYRKQLIGSALLTLVAVAAQAQTAAGTLLLGGSAGFTTNTGTRTPVAPQTPPLHTDQHSWWLGPSVGYFVTERLALGVSMGVGRAKQTADLFTGGVVYPSTQTRNSLDVGPFARYYLMLGEKTGFFGQLTAGYTRTRDEYLVPVAFSYSSWQTGKGAFARFTPGFVYFPTPKLGLELTMGHLIYSAQSWRYSTSVPQPNNTDTTSRSRGFSANVGISALQVGAQFYFGG